MTRDIAWKAACGLALDAEAFDPTVFVYWRRRLNASERPHRIDEMVKGVARHTGVLAGKTRRALDSTVLEGAVATQGTVTQLVAAIRKVLRLVPEAGEVALSASDYQGGGKPDIAWDDPVARDALVTGLVSDAIALIDCLPVTGLTEEQERAVALLALVAGQGVEPGEQPGSWRIARAVAKDRVVSVEDPPVAARSQVAVVLPRRLQGACGGGARNRADHRAGPDRGQRPRRAGRCRAAGE